MPLPIVYPKRHRFGREWKRKDTSDNIRLLRYRYNKINDFDEYFVEDYEEELEEICDILSECATDNLQRLIKERAYADSISPSYVRTDTFPDAFEVEVSVSVRTGALHFDIIFYYDYLQDYAVDDSSGWELPPHISVVDGSDVRQRLPDILNTPIEYYYYESYDRKKRVPRYHRAVRKGRWYETFDKWFRTYGEQLFLKLCRERGLI